MRNCRARRRLWRLHAEGCPARECLDRAFRAGSRAGLPEGMTGPRRDHGVGSRASEADMLGVGPAPILVVVLAMLTLFGPISMDLYLPVLPSLAADLHATTSAAQLTMTTCLLGLATGQIVAGPISDRFGRRGPLLVGVLLFILTSALCALSASIVMLVVFRFVQGLAGAVGLVIAQAAGRDVYTGTRLTRYYGRIVVLSGLAAVAAPVIGGQLAAVLDWRGLFAVLAATGVVILVAVLVGFRETLPVSGRTAGGLRHTASHVRILVTDRLFLGATVASSLTSAAYFGYLGAASFVLQDIYSLPPAAFSLVFGLNAFAFALFGFLAGRLAEWWTERGVFAAGLGIIVAGAIALLAAAVFALPLPATVGAFVAIAAGAAAVSPPSTSLALVDYPHFAGTASSILGVARFTAGAAAAPLVGLGGSRDMIPLGLVAVGSTVGAVIVYRLMVRQRATKPPWAPRMPLAGVLANLSANAERALDAAGIRADTNSRENQARRSRGSGEVVSPGIARRGCR